MADHRRHGGAVGISRFPWDERDFFRGAVAAAGEALVMLIMSLLIDAAENFAAIIGSNARQVK